MKWTISYKLHKLLINIVVFERKNCWEMSDENTGTLRNRLFAKRKRLDTICAKKSPTPQVGLDGEGGRPGFEREMPMHLVQCPDGTTSKEFQTIDRKELKTLRMQIAMISDTDGDRPIHVAVVQENLMLLRKLCALMLKTAIPLDLTNYLRQTPLHLAVMVNNIEIVQLLLKCGSSLILRDRNGNTVLHLAVKTDVKKPVLCLILSHPHSGTIINTLDHEGYTALHYAVMRRNRTAVTCLHRSGADMDAIDGKSGRTALIHAIVEGNTDMVSHLLSCGVNYGIADYSGRSAFELSLQASNEEIVQLLEKQMFQKENSTSSSSEHSEEGKEDSNSHRTKKLKRV